ncbi:MAG: hypothetical protein J4G00_11300, partial [Actinomycetia bacterium]|nr:hypothetical protein [Actinomycetes bacterium]
MHLLSQPGGGGLEDGGGIEGISGRVIVAHSAHRSRANTRGAGLPSTTRSRTLPLAGTLTLPLAGTLTLSLAGTLSLPLPLALTGTLTLP